MLHLPGYTFSDLLLKQGQTVYFRATRNSDKAQVLIKTLQSEFPAPTSLLRLRHEYEMLQEINHPQVIRPLELLPSGKSLFLILDSLKGSDLKSLLKEGPLSIDRFLSLALQLSGILQFLHEQDLVFNNLHSGGIFLEESGLKILDFSLVSELSSELSEPVSLRHLEGELAYCSPEQTGRINKAVDYRSDFYSLGIVLYELLTGRLPFVSQDPLELIHAHIARIPRPANSLRPEVPEAIAAIVQKLLAKNPEDRYQSETGLQADLNMCRTLIREKGKIGTFSPGLQEEYRRFAIPQKLYGREKEIRELLSGFSHTHEQPAHLVLVYGYSGIGKSALINEIHKPVVERNGYFLSGKFDQYRRNIPYSAFIQAFDELIRQLLSQSDEQIEQWRKDLLQVLGENAGLMAEVIPELELIIGPHPAPRPLPPTEAENRFLGVFQDFIQVFTNPDHPIVLFLDDLQWADLGSLNLMKLILNKRTFQNLLLIGAYRDNEVQEGHPLLLTLAELGKEKVFPSNIELKPLTISHITELVSDTLHMEASRVLSLAQLVFDKTQGNPFFLIQLLKTLYEHDIIYYDNASRGWRWESERIQELGISDNVVDLLTRNMDRLPKASVDRLRLAACIGAEFDLAMLATVCQASIPELIHDLKPVIKEQLVLPQGKHYSSMAHFDPSMLTDRQGDVHDLKVTFRFLHDRVQQAAYSLIPEENRKEAHLAIGRLLLGSLDEETLEDKLFDVVGHLNQGRELIVDPAEKIQVARLNLSAGIRAKNSASYVAATRFLGAGIELIGPDCWTKEYELSVSLYKEKAESDYLALNYDEAELHFDEVLNHARSRLEKLRIYHIRNLLYTKISKTKEALEIGRKALKLYNIRFPRNPLLLKLGAFSMVLGFKFRMWLKGRSSEDLLNWKVSEDPEHIAINFFLLDMATSAYQNEMDLMPMLCLTIINRSLKYGNTAPTAYGYGAYATILGSGLSLFKQGNEYGKMAVKMSEKIDHPVLKWKLPMVYLTFISHWREPISQNTEGYWNVLKGCQANGDQIFEGYCMVFYFWKRMASGDPLIEVYETCKDFTEILLRNKNQDSFFMLWARFQSLRQLLGQLPHLDRFDDAQHKEANLLPELQANGNKTALGNYQTARLQSLYMFGYWEKGLKIAEEAAAIEENMLGVWALTEMNFFTSLLILGLMPTLKGKRRRKLKLRLMILQAWMGRFAKNTPENFLHRHLLVKAEKARVKGQYLKAMDLYDEGIKKSGEIGFIQDEALANELAARFYLGINKESIARTYLREAYYLYEKWGAIAKTRQLREQYPAELGNFQAAGAPANEGTFATSDASALDIFTIVKASSTISREIDLDRLLQTLLSIIMENAGAQKGTLILEKEEGLSIVASGRVDRMDESQLQNRPVKGSGLVPESIIYLVARTRESMVLDHAEKDDSFGRDPYVQKNQPKSILCAPILNQGRLVGLIYLENNLTYQAFTAQRIDVVDILTGQAAISIENARLYTGMNQLNLDLKDEVLQRKEAQEALFASEQRLMQYLEGVPVGISVLTAQGKPFYSNKMAEDLLGKDLDADLEVDQLSQAYNLYQAGTPDLYPVQKLPPVKALLHGETSSVSDLEIRRGGKAIPLEAIATPIYDKNGTVIFAITAFSDISERLSAERQIKSALQHQVRLKEGYSRFVPAEFLEFLEKDSVLDVNLGDNIIGDMTILFSDIRSYTTLSENMTLEENFRFINNYLGRVAPVVESNKGLINQFYGDGVMALFRQDPEDALRSAIQMQQAVSEYNQERAHKDRAPIQIGIGLHSGSVVLGIIGDERRMDATVISDSVNTASRIENLTKLFGSPILVSESTYLLMSHPEKYQWRFLGKVMVQGKMETIGIYECYDGDPEAVRDAKNKSLKDFDAGMRHYYSKEFIEAAQLFEKVLSLNPNDKAARLFLKNSAKHMVSGVPDNWTGVEEMPKV